MKAATICLTLVIGLLVLVVSSSASEKRKEEGKKEDSKEENTKDENTEDENKESEDKNETKDEKGAGKDQAVSLDRSSYLLTVTFLIISTLFT